MNKIYDQIVKVLEENGQATAEQVRVEVNKVRTYEVTTNQVRAYLAILCRGKNAQIRKLPEKAKVSIIIPDHGTWTRNVCLYKSLKR